jgi:hypothetical protein
MIGGTATLGLGEELDHTREALRAPVRTQIHRDCL